MAIFAVQLILVLCAVCRVQHLAAHSAFEASFVPFVSTGNSFLGGVHRLAALGALWVLSWLERHLGVGFLDFSLELEHSLTHLFSLLIQILLCWRRGWKGQKNVKKLGWESLRTST